MSLDQSVPIGLTVVTNISLYFLTLLVVVIEVSLHMPTELLKQRYPFSKRNFLDVLMFCVANYFSTNIF